MPLPRTLCRGLTPSKPKETSSFGFSRSNHPTHAPSQATASTLQRSIQKSTVLSGRQPPRAKSSLTPEQILDLTMVLSQPVDTPMLTSSIANLKSPLTRSRRSSPAHYLCHVHTWFDLRWIDELTSVIGEELGPRLDSLRNAPRQLRSIETDEMLGMLQSYAHIFPAYDPDGSRMANPYQCNIRNCAVCSVTSCRACKLSQFLQNQDAVRALNVCVKGRKKRSRPWPEACAWLDPLPGCGWELRWMKEGLPVLSDRIIIREWRKAGGQERLTAAMACIQAEVLADRDAVERQFEKATRASMESKRTNGLRGYDDIVERKWTVCEEAMKSSETINLLKRLGLDDDEGESQVGEKKADSYETAYHHLVGTNSQLHIRPSSHRESTQEQASRTSRASSVASHHTASFNITPTSTASQDSYVRDRSFNDQDEAKFQFRQLSEAPTTTPRHSSNHSSQAPSISSRSSARRPSPAHNSDTIHSPPHERNAQSWGASYSNLLGPMAQTRSKLSLHHDVELEPVSSTSRASSSTLRGQAAQSSRDSSTSRTLRSSGSRDSHASSRSRDTLRESRPASNVSSSRVSRAQSKSSLTTGEPTSRPSSHASSRPHSDRSFESWESEASSRPASNARTSTSDSRPPSTAVSSSTRPRTHTQTQSKFSTDSWAVFENSPLGTTRRARGERVR